MKEDKKVSKLDSIKLVYNEKSKRIVANLITIVDGVKVPSRTIDNIEVIKVLIEALVKQSKLSVSDLIDREIIVVDNKLMEQGAIVLNNVGEYNKYIFDKDTGSFVPVRITRKEKRELGILKDDESYEELPEAKFDDKSVEKDTPVVELTPVVESTPVVETVPVSEPVEKEIINGIVNGDMSLLHKIAKEIQELNPSADIRVGKIAVDSDASYRFFSSIPVESLVLPENFYLDKDVDDWINYKVLSQNEETGRYEYVYVRFLVNDLSLADESKLEPSLKEPVVSEIPAAEIKYDAEEIGKTVDREKAEESEKKEEEPIKGVKHLKINKKALVAVIVAGTILAGSILGGRSTGGKRNRGVTNTTNTRYETTSPNNTYDDTYNSAQDTYNDDTYNSTQSSYNYGSTEESVDYSTDSINNIMQRINDMCISFKPCNFYNLVDEFDRQSIKVINSYRNEALSDLSKVRELMDEYVKYVFEGTIWFKNDVIKGYDYLPSISKYAVLVSGQTVLQLCNGYSYNNYTYNDLINMFDNKVDEVSNELLHRTRTY